MENEPWVDEAWRDLAHTARVMRCPRCQCCDEHLMGEMYVDLEPFGLRGYACGRCVDKHTFDIGDLEV